MPERFATDIAFLAIVALYIIVAFTDSYQSLKVREDPCFRLVATTTQSGCETGLLHQRKDGLCCSAHMATLAAACGVQSSNMTSCRA